MTNQEKKKLIDYLISREYNVLEGLHDIKLYSIKKRIGLSQKGLDVYLQTRITFYTIYRNKYRCVLESKIYEFDNSNFFDMMMIQKKIESVESFIEFEKGITATCKLCNDHWFKICE